MIEEKTKRRAKRRHHKERIKQKAKRVLKEWDLNPTEEMVGRFCNNLKKCSCAICGNVRKYEGRSFKEVVADLDYDEEIEELEENTNLLL